MIEFIDFCKSFDNQHEILKHINFTISPGKIVGIIGKSGAGKSTLLRAINGLEKPSSGHVLVNNTNISRLSKSALRQHRQRVSIIFQQYHLFSARNVFNNVALPLEVHRIANNQLEQRVRHALALVELTDKATYYPHQLSGGQKQRVAIARALVTEPSILLCDEATAALDPINTGQILALLKKINCTLGVTIVLITHELSVIDAICEDVAVIHQGSIVETGSVTEIFQYPQAAITQQLINENNRGSIQ